MADNVIHIRFSEDLDSPLKNRLRYRMELAEWKREWREAEAAGNYAALDRLDRQYDYLGLP